MGKGKGTKAKLQSKINKSVQKNSNKKNKKQRDTRRYGQLCQSSMVPSHRPHFDEEMKYANIEDANSEGSAADDASVPKKLMFDDAGDQLLNRGVIERSHNPKAFETPTAAEQVDCDFTSTEKLPILSDILEELKEDKGKFHETGFNRFGF